MFQVRFPGYQIWGIEIFEQEFYWDKTLRYNLRGSRGSRVRWREMVSLGGYSCIRNLSYAQGST